MVIESEIACRRVFTGEFTCESCSAGLSEWVVRG